MLRGALGTLMFLLLAGEVLAVNFTERVVSTSVSGACAVSIDDMDGDGDLDLVSAARNDGKVHVFLNQNDTPATFVSSEVGTVPDVWVMKTAFINNDAHKDIVLGTNTASDGIVANDEIVWLENQGDNPPTFVQRNLSWGWDRVNGIAVGNLNTGAAPDILVAFGSNQFYWIENFGGASPSFSNHSLGTISQQPWGLAIGDLDKDSDNDFVVGANTSQHFIRAQINGGGAVPTFATTISVMPSTVGNYPTGLAIDDLDGDGDNDVIACLSGLDGVYWFESNGAATPAYTQRLIAGGIDYPMTVSVADIDDDGRKDIVTASRFDNKVALHRNLGGTPLTFESQVVSANAINVYEAAVGDIDGDGDIDIASASMNDYTVRWFQNNTKADLSITKSFQSPSVETGQTMLATITVRNTGPDLATDVIVTDPVPQGCTFDTAASDPAFIESGGVVSYTVPSMAVGAEVSFVIGVKVNKGYVRNTATVISDMIDVTPADKVSTTSGEVLVRYPFVKSITRTTDYNSSLTSVNFLVTLSEDVTGVDFDDFVVTKTGSADGFVAMIQPGASAGTFSVTVNGVAGTGTLRLDLVDDGTIVDAESESLAGPENGAFDQGQAYSIDNDKPASQATAAAGAFTGSNTKFYVMFNSSDTGTGVQSVQLYYRRGGVDPYRPVGSPTTDGFVQVDTGAIQNGGDGTYEFYTVATDKAGNVEDAPAQADLSVLFHTDSGVESFTRYNE